MAFCSLLCIAGFALSVIGCVELCTAPKGVAPVGGENVQGGTTIITVVPGGQTVVVGGAYPQNNGGYELIQPAQPTAAWAQQSKPV